MHVTRLIANLGKIGLRLCLVQSADILVADFWGGLIKSAKTIQIVSKYGRQIKHGLGQFLESLKTNRQFTSLHRHRSRR